MSLVLQKTNGVRAFTLEELNTLSFRLLSSGLSFQRSSDVVYYILDQHGRMLIQQAGPDWYAGQALYEAFTPSWSPAQAFNMEYVPKAGGSSVGSIIDALVSLGFQQYSSLSSLADVNALLFSQPVPSQARWKSVDSSSQETTLALTRNHNTFQTRQFYGDLGPIEVPHNFRLTRQHITQNFDSGILVNDIPCSKVELAGMYMIDVGDGQTVKIGPTNRRPIITLVGDVTVGVQVGDSWTEAANGGVSAQDADGNALTVVTTGTVDTSILGISTLTYTAVSSQGDIAEVKMRYIVATDVTAPSLTLTGGNISLPVGDTWGGEPGFSAIDNLDGDITSQVQITGWDGETGVAGQFQRNYEITDSQGNVASTFRSVSIAVPSLFEAAGPWTTFQYLPTFLGTALTGEPDQLALGTGYGIECKFSYRRSSDPQGVICALLDSSSYANNMHYESPPSRAVLAWRIDQTSGVIARLQQSHPSWGSNRYIGDVRGVTVADQTDWTEVTTRIWDGGSDWKLSITAGSTSSTKSMAKTGSALYVMPRTSSINGACFNCVETNSAVTTSEGWLVNNGEVKDFSLAAYTAP